MATGVSAGLTPARKGRRFGLTVGIAFLVLTALLLWRRHETAALVTAILGGLLIVSGSVAPKMLLPVERGWMAMAHAISKVTTPIFMGIVYFIVVAPIGIIMRALGKNPLVHPLSGGGHWRVREHEVAGRGGMTRQF